MTARSFLFVPGDRPDMLAKALGRGADAIIVDLEDAVPLAGKGEARRQVASFLASDLPADRPEVWVRVNNRADLIEEDLDVAVAADGVVIPKVEHLSHVESISQPVIALIESARGWAVTGEIAACPTVVRLACGEADLAADLGVTPSPGEPEFLPFRMEVVRASAAAGIDRPVGPVSTDFRDLDAFASSTEALMRMGFGARLVIHPAQVEVVNRSLTPSPTEIAWARAILAAAESNQSGVFVDDRGRMVDEAVLRNARRIVDVSHQRELGAHVADEVP